LGSSAAGGASSPNSSAVALSGLHVPPGSGAPEITPAWLQARAEVSRAVEEYVGPVRSSKGDATLDKNGDRDDANSAANGAATTVDQFGTLPSTSHQNSGIKATPSAPALSLLPDDKLVEALRASQESRGALIDQFLRARHGSAAEAEKMLHDALVWRTQVNIPEYITKGSGFLSHPNAFFPMRVLTDPHKGHKQAVVYALLRLLDKRRIEREPFADAVIAFFENLYFNQNYPVEPVTVIVDLRGWSVRRHTPYRAVKEGLQVLQSYYPDRLGRVFLVNYSSTLRVAYAAISPIIDPGA
jgi:hypothetical protein